MPTLIKEMLIALLGSEENANIWWNSPNKAFDNCCPKDCNVREVKKYLFYFLQN